MTSSPGIEPGPHWWEASALTTTPSLLPEWGVVEASEPEGHGFDSCWETSDFLFPEYACVTD